MLRFEYILASGFASACVFTTVSCAQLPLPSKVDDAYYFDVSAGELDYASLYGY